jgi:hypothetical protein
MTQYLAHLIMYPYLVIGGYSTEVNDVNNCHNYIDTCLQTEVVQEKPDPRLVMYGVCLKEYVRATGGLDSNTKDQSRQHKHKTY